MVFAACPPTRRSLFQNRHQCLEHSIKIFHDIAIADPQRLETVNLHHDRITLGVPYSIMRVPIDLNYKPERWTEEVDDPLPNHDLSPELSAFEPAVAQRHPQAPFRFRHMPAHFRSMRAQRLSRDATTPNPLL